MRSLAQLLLTLLLNASWQVTVVTLFAVCANWLLRETAAWCRHTVWVAAIVISLCLPVVSVLNAIEFSPIPDQAVGRIALEPNVTLPVSASSLRFAEPILSTDHRSGLQPARDKGLGSSISLNRNLAAVLLTLYALFLLYRGFKLFWAWRRTAAIMRCTSSAQIPERAVAIIAKCQSAIGVTRVRVVSASVPVPITAGLFNPLIILPERLLNEADDEVLLSAIGHELVHVARRDYILNLVYEIVYLPLSFHPAAAVLRRRIKQTRELCCDELVARKLLAPQVYARSLVRLIGSVPLAGRLAPDTTIGITDADILEVRIMSLLKTSKISPRRNALLLFAAFLLLAAPCGVAAAFALQFDIDRPEAVISQKDEQDQKAAQKLERAREDLQRKERELAERMEKNPNPQGEDLEKLRRMEIELAEASARLNQAQESQHLKEAEISVRQIQERLAQIVKTYPGDEARMREVKERLEQLQRSLPENLERSRELRERLAMVESQYPNAAHMAEHLQTLQRAQEELAQQQEDISQEKRKVIEEKIKMKEGKLDREKYKEELERAAKEDIEEQSKIKGKLYEKMIREDLDGEIRAKIELDEEYRQNSLTQAATVSMDRAIQIAVSQHPGKVLSCNLGKRKDGQVFYRLVIIGDKNAATHVWVSATDGQILKTEQE